MKILEKLGRFFDRMIGGFFVFASLLLILSMLIISLGVASRYLLGRPWGWVVEISEYSLVYITFLVAAWVLKQAGHVRMDLILDRMSSRVQSMMNLMTSTVGSIVCFVLTWFGVRVTWDFFKTGYFTPTLLELPKFIMVGVIPLGFLLLGIQFLKRASTAFSDWKASQTPEKSSS